MEVVLAQPRGFCAGVTRAIETVERALEKFGPPIYVRHEIVHNKYVVDSLKAKGVIFVDEVSKIPADSIAIFSAHGVSDKVESDAKEIGLDVIDATCPLVNKVHREAKKLESQDYEIILIGHEGHPEVEGTSGKVKKDMILVTSEEDARNIKISPDKKLAYVTQTTLSVDDTKKIVGILQQRFKNMEKTLATKDICYATQNRQDAVRELSRQVDMILVIGSKNSSNSNRLRDLAIECGVESHLINNFSEIDKSWFDDKAKIGITAGASAPEILVEGVIAKLREISAKGGVKFKSSIMSGKVENTIFALPRKVRK